MAGGGELSIPYTNVIDMPVGRTSELGSAHGGGWLISIRFMFALSTGGLFTYLLAQHVADPVRGGRTLPKKKPSYQESSLGSYASELACHPRTLADEAC